MSTEKRFYPTPVLVRYALVGAAASVASTVAITQQANAAGTVPPDVQTAVDNASATATALGPLALVCLSVALVPWASMLTLRFINMVLSRV